MSRRTISALVVFLLLASVAVPAVVAAETEIVKNKVDLHGGLGFLPIKEGEIVLSTYFDFDGETRPIPHVVEQYAKWGLSQNHEENLSVMPLPENGVKVELKSKGYFDLGVGKFGEILYILTNSCEVDGHTTTTSKKV